MRNSKSVKKSFIFIFIISFSAIVQSQTKKIALLSMEDTTIVHQHLGTTAFTNFTDTLHLDIPLANYVQNKLVGWMSTNYDVTIVKVPDSIRKHAISFWGRSKEFKRWYDGMRVGYDFIVVVSNTTIPTEMNLRIPENSSGFYSRGPLHGPYTTIDFNIYRAETNKLMEYYNLGGNLVTQLKDFKMPENKRSFTPEMLTEIKKELLKHMDTRIKYFLNHTYIVPPDVTK